MATPTSVGVAMDVERRRGTWKSAEEIKRLTMSGFKISNSLCDVRRQCELPSPQELRDLMQDGEQKPSLLSEERATCRCCSWSPKAKAYKNLFGIAVSYMILFSVHLAVVGLQSSVNDDDGLGLASLCILYGIFIFSGFYSSSVIRLFGTKYTLIVCYVGFTLYTSSNYYPHWYTLIPGSVCVGIVFGPLLASLNTHITTIAIQCAPALKENSAYLVSLFTGILAMFYKLSYIPANLASSVILLNGRQENTSILDTSLGDICNNTEAMNFDRLYLYILLSVYVVFDIVAIVILISFVDHLGVDTRFLSVSKMYEIYFKKPFVATFKMFLNWKLILIAPMMGFDGFVVSFGLGQFAKVYISDCVGVHWIGFTQMAFGFGAALTAFTAGRLVKYIPQYFIVYTFMAINLGIVIFLILWDREPSYVASFLILFGWGACEGIWNSIPPSLVGILLPNKQEAAYSVLRMVSAVGFTIGFLFAIFLESQIQLWVAIGLIIIMFLTYTILIFKMRHRIV